MLVAPAGASGQHGLTRHERQVIQFFQHHPRQAATPAGGRILSHLLPKMVSQLRSLESARLAGPATWLDSVSLVGRYYGSGMSSWEKSCSSTEGGWGGFVWYQHLSYPRYGYNSTPGGWMQFMGGTFYGIIDKAIATARSKGIHVPASARSYYSPFGQALAGAQMILDGRSGEWTGDGC